MEIQNSHHDPPAIICEHLAVKGYYKLIYFGQTLDLNRVVTFGKKFINDYPSKKISGVTLVAAFFDLIHRHHQIAVCDEPSRPQ